MLLIVVILLGIRKREATKLLQNIDLTENSGTFIKNKYQKLFFKL